MPRRPLRFCMVATFYPPYHFGGDAIHAWRLSEALADHGHRVDVVHSVDAYRVLCSTEPEVEFAHHPNIVRHRIESRWPRLAALASHQLGSPAFYARRLREVLEGNEYDVIHFFNMSLIGAPGVLRLGRAVKLLTTSDYWLVCPTHVLFAFNREACTERRCLACTLSYRRPPQLWRNTGTLETALEELDCILPPSRFAMEMHRANGIHRPMARIANIVAADASAGPVQGVKLPGRPFFACVGRLEKLKGVQDLLRVFSGYREADLLIVGKGSYGPALREQASSLSHVHFADEVHPAALAQVYREAIAVVVPSICYETFGLTAPEAMCHGTPAIVRRIGALQEVIEETGGGLSFTTPEECVEAMERLRTQPELRERLGRRGREMVRAEWTTEAHLRKYLDLVDSLMEAKGRPHG